MAELVGLISSVITISQAVTEVVTRAKSIYRAQEEFDELQVSTSKGVSQYVGYHSYLSISIGTT